MATKVAQTPEPRTKRSWKRWVSLRAYGLVTSSLFGATTSPVTMRARFERLSRVSREKLQRKFPRLLRVGDAARKKGTSATVLIGKGMQHDWPLTLPWLDESRLAWNAMRTFVEEHSRCAPGAE
jgi:hypothetical protein